MTKEINFILTNYPRNIKNVDTSKQLNFNTNHRMVRSTILKHSTKKVRKQTEQQKICVPIPLPDDMTHCLNISPKKITKEKSIQDQYDIFFILGGGE